MTDLVKLSELPIGTSAVVREFSRTGSAGLRLQEMGLLVGTRIALIRTAPLGDPLEIRVRGYNLSLRHSEAEFILVEAVA
jgi:ferrous iron transport protein A